MTLADLMPFGTDADLLACCLSTWRGEAGRCRWCDAELPKRRRRWCSNACADAYSENHWWTAARHAAKKRDHYRCVRPGCEDLRLQVHHKDPILGRHGEGGCHHHQEGLETLCHPHHHHAHHGERKTAQLRLAEIRPDDEP